MIVNKNRSIRHSIKNYVIYVALNENRFWIYLQLMKKCSPLANKLKLSLLGVTLTWAALLFLSFGSLASTPSLVAAIHELGTDAPKFTKSIHDLPVQQLAEVLGFEKEESEKDTDASQDADLLYPKIHFPNERLFVASGASKAYFFAHRKFFDIPYYLLYHCFKSEIA